MERRDQEVSTAGIAHATGRMQMGMVRPSLRQDGVSSGILAPHDMKDYEFFLLNRLPLNHADNRFAERKDAYRVKAVSFGLCLLKVRQGSSIAGRPADIDSRSCEYGRIPLRVNDLRGAIESTGRARNRARLSRRGRLVASSTDSQSLSMQG
jgi:hypothetical protein